MKGSASTNPAPNKRRAVGQGLKHFLARNGFGDVGLKSVRQYRLETRLFQSPHPPRLKIAPRLLNVFR
jgi:hypothetical protein